MTSINLLSSKDNDEECLMHLGTGSNYIELIINDNEDEFIEELF